MCELDERALTQSKPMHIIDIQHTEKFFNNLKNGINFEQERILSVATAGVAQESLHSQHRILHALLAFSSKNFQYGR